MTSSNESDFLGCAVEQKFIFNPTVSWCEQRKPHHQIFLKGTRRVISIHAPASTHPPKVSLLVMIKQQLDSVRRGGTGCTWPGKKQMYSELKRSPNAPYCTTTMNITSFPKLIYLEQEPFSTSYTSVQDTKKLSFFKFAFACFWRAGCWDLSICSGYNSCWNIDLRFSWCFTWCTAWSPQWGFLATALSSSPAAGASEKKK